ncbi:hypothetical protein [Parapedobacter soli]|uniref:hypothetical protein n=1 Tax=Parapedobacter soli TaxID=416955 RepID=UPI0021C842FD|nr:hypothetical protein [Parapedobacter soli]
MQHVTKQHPLKPISLSFHEGKQPPAFEVEALKQYKKAHDETWKRKMGYEAEKGQLMLLDSEIAELSYEIFCLGERLEVFEEAVGIGEATDPSAWDRESDFDLNAFFDRILKHSQAVQQLHGQIVAAATQYNKTVASLYEDDYLIDPMYFDILNELYRRHEEVEVDIVSLDKDHQDFLGAYGEVDKLREEYMQLGQDVFERYAQLIDDSEHVYKRADIVQDRLDEMMDGK